MRMIRKSSGRHYFATLLAVIVIALFSKNAPAYDRRDAQDCAQTIDNDRSVAGCTRLLASRNLSDRDRAVAYVNRGNAYTQRNDYDRALTDFNEAIQLEPRYSMAYNNRGFVLKNKGDSDGAIANFSEAIRIDPRNILAYINRASAYGDKGDYHSAVADGNEAIRISPTSAQAYHSRAIAYNEIGDDNQAIADDSTAIRIDPKFANAYVSRADAYTHEGDNDLALADCDEAIRIDPKNAAAYVNRGNAYSAKSDYDRAITSYDLAIRLNPLDPEPFTGRGLAYEKKAEVAKARSDFEAALGIPARDKETKQAVEKARERLAALSGAPASAAPPVAAIAPAVTVAASSAAPIAANDHRIALVIGNSAYEKVPALPNPERDARLVAETLKRTGFESITVQTNLRKDPLIAALRDFASRAEKADWAVVYYAGHGIEVGGINYLVPVDARIAADRDIGFEAVPLEQVLNAAERAKKLRLVILDACRDNPFASQMKRTLTVASRSMTRGLAAVEPEAGTLVVFAAKDGETAIDGDGNNSPFALAFVKNLQTPGLEVRRLFDYVRDDVMETTGRKQKPFSYGSISGRQDFYFVAGK
jgi:tetratricopeptide (TPR) repeat protein